MARWIRFLIAILFGLVLGLAYGWVATPVRYVDTTPNTLRIDYKTDYVLMVAEAYQFEEDPQMAARRLATLGDTPPVTIIDQSIQFAQKAGYTEPDIASMQTLLSALQSLLPGQEAPAP
jgi:hypothetical protein